MNEYPTQLILCLESKFFFVHLINSIECISVRSNRMFEIKTIIPTAKDLVIRIKDWDLLTSDDVIGQTTIDLENRFLSKYRATCGLPLQFNVFVLYKRHQLKYLIWISLFLELDQTNGVIAFAQEKFFTMFVNEIIYQFLN